MLGADEWWANFALESDDADWRDVMAAHALDLYRQTAAVMRPGAGVAGQREPVDSAIEILRELADACALHSYPWSPGEREDLRIPDRAAIEQKARSEGVDEWVRGLGHALDLRTTGVVGKTWPPTTGQKSENDLATYFSEAAALYAVVLEARSTPRGWDVLRAEVFRRGACRHVAIARSWLLWTKRRQSPEAVNVAHATLLMAQMFFVASRDAEFGETLFPGERFLRDLLGGKSGTGWFVHHGGELPAWLDRRPEERSA
jgi:hypothetical protein